MALQLPLGISLPDIATFNSFVPGPHTLALNVVKDASEGRGELQLYLWGETSVGKTHLLQAACHQVAALGKTAGYLPLQQFIDQPAELLEGLENLSLVCLDDVQCIAADRDWEVAVFRLINNMRERHHHLMIAADRNINELGLHLPDLASRFLWGPVFQLKPLSDEDKMRVLQHRASTKGLELSEEVAGFMLRRFPRHIQELCHKLDQLDNASLAAQRRLTIPFVKLVLKLQ